MSENNSEIIHCNECIHRPVTELSKSLNVQFIKAPKIEDIYDDLTCPFLCDDIYYNSMPKDRFLLRLR